LNPYLSSYLAEHVALGGHWSALGARPNVIDRLNIDELTSTVLRREFGRSTIPAVVAGVVMNRGAVRGSSLLDRIILRCIGVSQIDGVAVAAGVTAADVPVGSAVVWSRRWHCDPLSVPLTGHTNWGAAVAAVPLPDGRTLLATTSDETVRLWDPITGTPVGDPLTGHTDAVTAVPLPDGRTLLATTSNDRTVRLWDPVTADGPPGTHHHRESRSQTYPAPAN